jgi:hypothetical protein
MMLVTKQVRRENRVRMKIEEKTIVRQISAFKASVIKRLDELEKSALLEMQTASQDSISQMEREESELADFSSSSSLFMTDALNADICLTMVFSSIIILSLFSRLFCTAVFNVKWT